MTLEERVGKLEVDMSSALEHLGKGMVEGLVADDGLTGRMEKLETQLAELDVLVVAIHETIKAVEAKVTEQ